MSDELRSHAKAINFGIIYGISDYGLANNTGVSRQDAAEYIRQYFRHYPRIKEFLDGAIEQGRRDGFVTTILGRRRYLPDIQSRNYARRQYAERMAMNTVLQGTAADLIKVAMVRLDEAFSEQGLQSSLVLQVHDELIWDMVPTEEEVVMELARKLMTTAIPLSVPLVIDFKRGANWESMEPVTDMGGGPARAGIAGG
ncbi:MAG: DNA polymerase [Firmicutes bacterium]|nr:DNA polymerase [Bacillota bacterium]